LLADLGILVVLAAAPAAGPSWRLYGEPQDTAESALREAVSRGGVAAVQPLTAVSQQYPDTVISGLARLAAGLSLVDAGRYAEALAHLTHADVQRTLLRDRALLAQGQAQEGLDRLEAAARSERPALGEWLVGDAGTPQTTLRGGPETRRIPPQSPRRLG
jgi:predicted negative regulator of RcsB-dependent stress response